MKCDNVSGITTARKLYPALHCAHHINKYEKKYRVITKSLGAWWLQYILQVH